MSYSKFPGSPAAVSGNVWPTFSLGIVIEALNSDQVGRDATRPLRLRRRAAVLRCKDEREMILPGAKHPAPS